MNNNSPYTTKYVLGKVGVTRPTLYKWFKEGKIPEVTRDRNNNRLFAAKDIERILIYKNQIIKPVSNNNRKQDKTNYKRLPNE